MYTLNRCCAKAENHPQGLCTGLVAKIAYCGKLRDKVSDQIYYNQIHVNVFKQLLISRSDGRGSYDQTVVGSYKQSLTNEAMRRQGDEEVWGILFHR